MQRAVAMRSELAARADHLVVSVDQRYVFRFVVGDIVLRLLTPGFVYPLKFSSHFVRRSSGGVNEKFSRSEKALRNAGRPERRRM